MSKPNFPNVSKSYGIYGNLFGGQQSSTYDDLQLFIFIKSSSRKGEHDKLLPKLHHSATLNKSNNK